MANHNRPTNAWTSETAPKSPSPWTSEHQPENHGGAQQKIDYDDDEFYFAIYELALNGMTNDEIADSLDSKLGEGKSLEPKTFGKMVNGNYPIWDKETNERRSARIKRILAKARRKTNALVRGRFLKVALGGIKTKNVSTVKRRLRIDGQLTDDEEIQTTTVESESAPSLQALQLWLRHHDPEWRKREMGQFGDEADPTAVPENVNKGIDIAAWIDQEVKDKESRETHPEEPKAEDPNQLSNMESAGE